MAVQRKRCPEIRKNITILKSRVMENEKITGKHWLIYGVLYPLGVILLAAAVESVGRLIF